MHINNQQLETPMLFLIFNHPKLAQQVFNQIRIAKSKKLFITCDGSQKNNSEDIYRISDSQKTINQTDWDC